MTWISAWAAGATFVIACAATWVMQLIALRQGILDVPNSRSSHSVTVPRGGGAAIVAAVSVGLGFLFTTHVADRSLLLVILVGGLSIALIGLLDDRRSVRPITRFAVHAGSAVFAVYVFGGIPPIAVGNSVVEPGWIGSLFAVLAIVWVLNLFNFMDGIDGIAASEAVFVCAAGAMLTAANTNNAAVAVALIVAAASLGFLMWNWPPAKIFMGDVGSGYLGYIIAILALDFGHADSVNLFVWLILGGAFFVDATVTLVRRLLRRERVYEAHRTHAYQWLARRWQSHRRVTLAFWMINVAWLLPSAWLCTRFPAHAPWITCAALSPLALVAIVIGAGRAENTEPRAV